METTSTPSHHNSREKHWKRRIQAATVQDWRPRVAALCAGLPEAIRVEAEQVAAIGVLVALEHWTPGTPFEPLAYMKIAAELRRWQAAGVAWTPKADA